MLLKDYKNMDYVSVDVEKLYKELNGSLFDGSLPTDYRIEFVPIKELIPYYDENKNDEFDDEGGRHDGVLRIIKLTKPLRNRSLHLRHILVHEMVHVAEGDEHEEAFFNRLIDIAQRGEEWAWDEARDYHPCQVRNLIHLWRNYPLELHNELDPRRSCKCKACSEWQNRGFPQNESLEEWHPWEPEGAPVHPCAEWIEERAYELIKEDKCQCFNIAREKARREAESLKQ